ncbi:MAG: sulfotransferase domain-containing protein [Gemmatimonadota bacterium]
MTRRQSDSRYSYLQRKKRSRFHKALKGGLKYALRVDRPAGMTLFPIFPDDLFLTSFPKSGNTWLRFLTANLLWPELDVSFENIDELVPDIYRKTNHALARMGRPRVLKSHEPYDPRYRRIVYVVRDPRSVLLSYQSYMEKMGTENHTLQDCAGVLFDHGRFVGTWQEHVSGWLGASQRNPERVMVLRYEDVLRSPESEVERLAKFLAVDPGPDLIRRAISASSFDSMKRLESEAGEAWEVTSRSERKDIPFVRSGEVAEWERVLGAENDLRDWIEERCGELLQQLGYARGPLDDSG